MGKVLKAFLVCGIAGVLLAYVVAQAMIEAEYSAKVAAIKRELEIYDLQAQQMYLQRIRLETVAAVLEAGLATERQTAKAKSEAEAQSGQSSAPTVLTMPVVASELKYDQSTSVVQNVTVDASSIRAALKLDQIRQKSQSSGSSGSSGGGSRTVSRAS